MCYAVYHATDIMQMVFHDATQWFINRAAHYRHVADVEADLEDTPLSRVFRLTNHLDDHPWAENAGVIWHDTTRPLRSTSVGDVVVNTVTNEAWMVMPFGFTLLQRTET